MISNRNELERYDVQSTLRFSTPEELQQAVIVYDAVDPTIPADDLASIPAALSEAGVWRFQKSADILRAERRLDGFFYLNIRDILGPHGSEKLLSKDHNLVIGYDHCEISRIWQTEAKRFSIPVADIETLYAALDQPFDIEAFSKALFTPHYYECPTPFIDRYVSPVTVLNDEDIEATLQFTKAHVIDPSREPKSRKRDHTHTIEDHCLTGPVRFGSSEKEIVPISMYLYICPKEGVTYDTAIEQRIRALGDKAEAAWMTPEIAERRLRKSSFLSSGLGSNSGS